MDKWQLKLVSEISDTDWKEKVKSETFKYLATEYDILITVLIFHDRDLPDGERKGLHCHMILEFRKNSKFWEIEFEAENLEQSRFDVPVSETRSK